MNRNRTVLAAGGISALLLVGSAGLAFANGILTTRPVDRVGTFQMIQARLVPATEPPSVATTTRRAVPGVLFNRVVVDVGGSARRVPP